MSIRFVLGAVLLLLIGVYLIIFFFMLNKKKSEHEVKNVLKTAIEDQDEIKLFFIEQQLVNKLGVNENQIKFFIYSERILAIVLFIASFIMFGMVGLGIFVCIGIVILMDNKLKEEIYESGITRIGETVAFMDYFVPSINSGNSAYQAFLGYIAKLDPDSETRELLIEYRNHKVNRDLDYQTPQSIKTITSIYENALYNEEKGVEDYLYIIEEAKQDLFQKQQYYNDYQAKVGEVLTPISYAYYIGVPAIIFMTMGSVGDFWTTIWGLVATIILVLFFFLFKYLVNKLNINTVRKIL